MRMNNRIRAEISCRECGATIDVPAWVEVKGIFGSEAGLADVAINRADAKAALELHYETSEYHHERPIQL